MLDRDVSEMIENALRKNVPAEPCIGQLEIPFDLEDVHKIYGGWSRERNNHLYHQIPHPLTHTKGLRLATDAESPSTR